MIDACALSKGYDVVALQSVDHLLAPREAVLQVSWQRPLRGSAGGRGKEDHGVPS